MRTLLAYLLIATALLVSCTSVPLHTGVTVTLADGAQTEVEYAIQSTKEALTRPLPCAVRAKYEDRLVKLQNAKKAGRRWVTKEDM